jgi:hypothetical protein
VDSDWLKFTAFPHAHALIFIDKSIFIGIALFALLMLSNPFLRRLKTKKWGLCGKKALSLGVLCQNGLGMPPQFSLIYALFGKLFNYNPASL